jgi:hypothetical protein
VFGVPAVGDTVGVHDGAKEGGYVGVMEGFKVGVLELGAKVG